jgi:Peptidase family M23
VLNKNGKETGMPLLLLLIVVFSLISIPGQATPPREEAPPLSGNIQAQVEHSVKQGDVLRIVLSPNNAKALASGDIPGHVRFAGRSASFYPQPDGSYLALIAVSVFQKPGLYPLLLEDVQKHMQSLRDVLVEDGRYKTQNVNVSAGTAGLQPLPGEMEAIQALKVAESSIRYWNEPFVSPTPDCQNSPFGVKRFHNGKPTGDYHKGVDLRSPQGRPIRATAGGTVRIARMYRLHGGTVGLDHGQGVSSIYIHMSKLNVHPNEVVKQGDIIGFVGSTGFATGPHLHWGMYVNGLPVNPNPWLSPTVALCK